MTNFLHYLDPSISLIARLKQLSVADRGKKFDDAMTFLEPLKIKDAPTHDHSLRVALLARRIGEFIHLDGRPLLYAGLLHDIGKMQTRLEVLQKTERWTEENIQEMMSHVEDGYRLIRGCFDFSAEIVLWHHRFQLRPYPEKMPPLLHDYSEGTKILIPFYGRMLSVADTFDALHRINEKHGIRPLNGLEIRQKMLDYNKDLAKLVRELYEADILTTTIFETK